MTEPVYVLAESIFERLRDAGDADPIAIPRAELEAWREAADTLETVAMEYASKRKQEAEHWREYSGAYVRQAYPDRTLPPR